ncbi:MAG: hypothetical protein ABI992_03215, partial [Chthoniobacterales bacterium]
AQRLAVSSEKKSEIEASALAAERAAFMARMHLEESAVADWLAHRNQNDFWLTEMIELEAACARERERVVTPEACKREFTALRFQLTIFEVEVIEFDTLDAAREALLCVREDGMEMEEVAAEGHYSFRQERLLLEDIAPELQQLFVSIIPGKVLEPIEQSGEYRLCRVLAKNEPDPEDAGVRRRVEQRVLDRHFAELVNQRVHWNLLFS